MTEATAAGGVGAQDVGVSFTPLHPWIAPPEQRLLKLAPAAFWHAHHVLPLRLDASGLAVVAGGRIATDTNRQLEAMTGHPVRLLHGARDEVDFWLDVLAGRRGWSEALADGLVQLLNQLGLAAIQENPLHDLAEEALTVEQVAASFGLTEEMAVEALALRARLPHVRLERYTLAPPLAALIPRPDAEIMRVVPVMARAGLAVFATPQVLGRRAIQQLRHLVGLDIRLLVCAPSAFLPSFAAVFGSAGISHPSPVLDDEAIVRALVENGTIDRARQDALLRLASVTRESPVTAALRLEYASARDLQRAQARIMDLPALSPDRVRVDSSLAERGAPALWRRWRCVPVGRAVHTIHVATDGPLHPEQVELMRVLLGGTHVSASYITPVQLDQLLQHLPLPVPDPFSAEDYLLEAGMLTPRKVEAARQYALREGAGQTFMAALAAVEAITPEDVVEAHAVARSRAWIELAHYTPEPGVADLLPEETARRERVVALRRQGVTLTCALLNRQDEVQAGPLEQETGYTIDPIFARVDDVDEAITRWYQRAVQPLPEAYDDFGRFLVRRGYLSRVQVERVWRNLEGGRSRLDEALTLERGLLTPERLAAAFQEYLSVGAATLELVQRRVAFVDALGQVRHETVWEDPVDRAVTSLVSGRTAIEHGFLPVSRVQDLIEVAFANPLDERAVFTAESTLRAPIRVLVATRQMIEVAQRRVYARQSIGERLMEAGVITQEQLTRAVRVHSQAGVRIGQALISLGFIAEEELASVLAQQAGVPFFDLRSTQPDPEVARRLSPADTRTHRTLPLYDDGAAVVVGCTDVPEASGLEELQATIGRPLQPVIVTDSAFDDALNNLYREEYLEHSASNLVSRSPDDSARWVLSRGQRVFFWGLLAVIGLGLATLTVPTLVLLIALATVFYTGFSAYKFYLVYRAITHQLEIATSLDEVAGLDDRRLPIYTILVPVYREAEVFPILVKAIDRLDYPKSKLDVKILLEEDDVETITVARASSLPSHFRLVVVPHGLPKGKPKACNYGLIHARGEYVVIFDAEDIPEPDQLKKAIVAFAKSDERLACVQAKLNYFNRDQNLLTRWFTTEYSMWFDLFLPGLDASGAPIPLGGTSNHFKTARLRELGAWDPHNVTEDADLGMRLYKAGWKTAVIDSTTYEEANSDVYNWIRQRSRWVKGYIQTYLVHMRHPIRLWRAIGPRAFWSFQLVIGGTFFGFLVNPVFWLLTALWFLTRWELIRELFPAVIFYMGALGLYFGNFAFTYLNVAGCLRRGYYDMVKYALLSPLYWALMSVAAWKGFLQLFYAPSYWEKTTHGLYKGDALRGSFGTTSRKP